LQAPRRARPVGTYRRLLLTAAAVIAVDQITKQIALATLDDGPTDLIDGVLSFRLTYNSGGAFGIAQGFPALFLIATAVVAAVILLWAKRLEEPALGVPLGLILGGGLGNVADRLFRGGDGRVVDFIDFHVWPVFNLADSSIFIGVVLILLVSARTGKRDSSDGLPGGKPTR
jgi:signal peptidase II